MSNIFLEELEKVPTGSTLNNAVAYSDTYSNLLNYFSNCNNFFKSYDELENTLNKCWYEDSELTLKLIGYIRAISRTDNHNGLEVKGLGLKKEGRLCLKWLYLNHPKTFYKNLEIFIVNLGSWQDLWHRDLKCWMINKDSNVINFIIEQLYIGITKENQNDLCLKYLPRHKSISNIKKRNPSNHTLNFHVNRNKILKTIADKLNIEFGASFTIKDLMKWKAEGNLHSWQQQISNQEYNSIDFNKLPGKVLQWITNEKEGESFLSRHKLEDKYIEWLESKSSLNNTAYIYELIKPAIEAFNIYDPRELSKIQKYTIEKQLNSILSKGLNSNLNIMPVIDTSGSMTCSINKRNVTALDVCLSLGIYFSMIQSGHFKDYVIGFDEESSLIKLSGSYLDRLKDLVNRDDFMGSTNFQSVIDLIIKTKQNNPNIPTTDFPDVYLVISDLQFNESEYSKDLTNHQEALKKFKEVGLPQPLFIWYNISPYGNNNFQNHKNDKGVINISGFDPNIINKLMSKDFQLEFEKDSGKSIKDISPISRLNTHH